MSTWPETARLDMDSLKFWSTLEDEFLEVDVWFNAAPESGQFPQLGDLYEADGDTPDEMRLVHIGPLEKKTSGSKRGHFMMTARFAEPMIPYASGMDGLYEVYRRPRTGRRGRRYGTRVFLATDTQAETLAARHLAEFTPMFSAGPWKAALLRELDIERRWRVGIARLTATYDSKAENARLEQVGKGILETDTTNTWMWWNDGYDELGGHRLGEVFIENGDRFRWVLMTGTQAWPYVQTQARIRVLVNKAQLSALAYLNGRVNSTSCPHVFSNAGPRKLWFNGLRTRERDDGSGRSDALVFLRFEPQGWNTVNRAVKEKQVVRMVDKKDNNDDDAGDAAVDGWETTSDAPVRLHGWIEEDFTLIDRFLQ